MKIQGTADQTAALTPRNQLNGRQPWRGVITPLVTPLTDNGNLDHLGLERLITHVLEGGVHGVFVMGTTGEASAVSSPVRSDVVRHAIRLVNRSIPVLVGISSNSVAESIRMANEAADCGATAVVVTAPAFLPMELCDLVRFIRIIERESPLPVILYNMPRLTGHWFEVETLRQTLELPNLIGLKDSSGDMDYFQQVLKLCDQRPDWTVMVGPEQLLAEVIALGGHGCVGGGSNLWPRLLVDIYESASNGTEQRLKMLQSLLAEMAEIYQYGIYATGVIRGLKCALELMGICSSRMVAPFEACDSLQRQTIESRLRQLGLTASH